MKKLLKLPCLFKPSSLSRMMSWTHQKPEGDNHAGVNCPILLPPPIGAFLKVIQQTEFGQLPDLTSQDEGSEVFDRKRRVLKDNYGQWDDVKVMNVKMTTTERKYELIENDSAADTM
eukprot:scaffold11600_cov256-Chaetoceros_neogracile.AAC.4